MIQTIAIIVGIVLVAHYGQCLVYWLFERVCRFALWLEEMWCGRADE